MLKTYSEWIAEDTPEQPTNTGSASTDETASDSRGAGTLHPPSSRAMCEYQLYRNDGLRQVNRGLVEQISVLKEGLEQAQTSLFRAQCIIARQKEMASIRSKRLRAGQSMQPTRVDDNQDADDRNHRPDRDDGAQVSQAPTSATDTATLRDACVECTSENTTAPPASANANGCSSVAASLTASDPEPIDEDSCNDTYYPPAPHACCGGSGGDERHQAPDQLASTATTTTNIDTRQPCIQDPEPADISGSSYSQLLALGAPESEDGEWHRRALRHLVQERELRRSTRSESESCASSPRFARLSFASSVDVEFASREEELDQPVTFQTLVALRKADTDDQLGEWQRQSLKRLSEERERQLGQHRTSASSAASLSPTNSSTSTHNFSNDEN